MDQNQVKEAECSPGTNQVVGRNLHCYPDEYIPGTMYLIPVQLYDCMLYIGVQSKHEGQNKRKSTTLTFVHTGCTQDSQNINALCSCKT